jgi:hypothetical protein
MPTTGLLNLIRSGIGQGHRDDYIPLVRLSRRNISRIGTQSTGPMPGYRRGSHFMAHNIKVIALLMLWLGALDVRESFPLWPFDHPHPLADWPFGQTVNQECTGTGQIMVIGRQGRRGRDRVGLPQVDLMITTGTLDLPDSLLVECASSSPIGFCNASPDSAKRLALSQRYARMNGMNHRVIDPAALDPIFVANLLALSDAPNTIERDVDSQDVPQIQECLTRYLDGDSICGAIWRTASQLGKNEQQVFNVFDGMAWSQQIDIDLGRTIYRTEPVVPGGRQIKTQLHHFFFGDS